MSPLKGRGFVLLLTLVAATISRQSDAEVDCRIIGPLTPSTLKHGSVRESFAVRVENAGTTALPNVNVTIGVYKNSISVSNLLGPTNTAGTGPIAPGAIGTAKFSAQSFVFSDPKIIVAATARTTGLAPHTNGACRPRTFYYWRWSDGLYRQTPPNGPAPKPAH